MTQLQRWVAQSMTGQWLKALSLSRAPLEKWWWTSLPGRLQKTLSVWAESSYLARFAEPLAVAVLCALIVAAPYVSTAVVGALLAVGGGLVLVLFALSPRQLSPLALPVTAYWLSALVALAASSRFALSLDGWIKLTLFMAGFALAAHLLQRPLYRSLAVASYLGTTLPVSLYGLWQYRVGAAALATWVDPNSPLADTTRVYSFLGNPNLLAAYLIPAVPLGIAGLLAWKHWGLRAMGLAAAAAASVCVILTFSRGGWIALAACLLVFGALLLQWLGERLPLAIRPWLPVAVLGLAAAILVAAVVAVPALSERALSIFSGREDSSNNFRLNVWAAVIEMIRAQPLFGIGPGNRTFEAIYPFFQRPKFDALSAYSIFLEVTVELGVLGLLAFLWLITAVLVQGALVWMRRQVAGADALWAAGATCALFGLLVDGLTDTVWFRPAVQVLWWLLCALVASLYLQHRSQAAAAP